MAYLEEFLTHIANNDLTKIYSLWEEYCASDTVDPKEFRQILEVLASSDVSDAFGKYVEMGLPLWCVVEDEQLSNQVLRLILDIQTTNSDLLADTAYKFLKNRYEQEKYFNLKIALIGLRDRKDFRHAISNYELLSHMDKGKFVYHTGGWGTGEIVDISLVREQLVIEFENVKDRKHISFEVAFNTLKPLKDDHFLARRFSDPDTLEHQARINPVEIVKILLRDLGPKNAAEIKEELEELVIPNKDWTKWWQSARAKLKKDPMIVTPANIRKPFKLRKEEVSMEERFDKALMSKKTPEDIIVAAYNFVKDIPEALKNETLKSKLIYTFLELSTQPAISLSRRLQIAIFLENFCHHQITDNTIETLIKQVDDIEGLFEDIEIVAFRRKIVEAIQRFRDDWLPIFSKLLLFSPLQNNLRDYIFKEISKNSTIDSLTAIIQKLVDFPTGYPEAFLWYFQKTFTGNDLPFSDKKGRCLFFENFFVLYHYLEANSRWRDFVKKMYSIISAKRFEIIRDILKGASLDFAKEFLLLASKCQSISKHDMNTFKSLVQVEHPSIGSNDNPGEDHTLWTTEEGYRKTRERIRQIGEVEMVENAKEVEAARALGDLRENAEYKFALERRTRLQAELKMLSDQIHHARILSPQDICTSEVGVGVIVELKDNNNNALHYSILGPWDTNPEKNIISYQSRFAQTMKGLKPGESFSFNGGNYTVIQLRSFLQ